ncbi:fungal-specific transcription factor domain-containing protein [Dactylonectria estremocensis]|uniref:Fungal-specific transcription factor domain-containing protein n=1 Tax=Dactylonectria estremocensis TaxID=1079267 RepID=A0A9P9JFC3_9HYPO|nr:fungal-specific transcription factor domain-containing protein [Dactylonectria estremocensis]
MERPNEIQKPRQKTRRPRAVLACELCRIKKNKCDEANPCSYCRQRNVECTYRGSNGSILNKRRFTPEYVRQLEEQVKTLQSSSDAPTVLPAATPGTVLTPGAFSDPASPKATPSVDASSLHGSVGQHRDWGYQVPSPSCSSKQSAQEISSVNMHTKSVEFYGSSSSVALLSRVQRNEDREMFLPAKEQESGSIVSNLHNPRFSPSMMDGIQQSINANPTPPTPGVSRHHHKCSVFVHSFFSSNHYIHPILDKHRFLQKCEQLWSGTDASQSSSFIALYYSILSLGALISVREEEPIDGITNRQWSRKFFDESLSHCYRMGMVTDLEMVQCYFFLAKICQNELNPHWAYMYVGQAVRTALAIGINREPPAHLQRDVESVKAESRTWWGLYSLEMEMSFAMGRPDTLGSDLYHNRRLPVTYESIESGTVPYQPELLEPPHCAIIRYMVDFSRITRALCLGIYLSDLSLPELLARANQLEQDLNRWVDSVPEAIRPSRIFSRKTSLKSVKDAQYAKRQRLVMTIRYHNLRILMFGSLLINSSPGDRASVPCSEGIQKCLDSAKQTIDIIYHVYQHHDFFRTWFYNITYISFATSIILVYLGQGASDSEVQSLSGFIEMAVEILDTMDECVVATKAAAIIQHALAQAQDKSASRINDGARRDGALPFNHQWGPLTLIDEVFDANLMFDTGVWDDTEALLRFLGGPVSGEVMEEGNGETQLVGQ